MYSRLLLTLVGMLLASHVMAAQQMLVNGEIKNFLDTDVRLQYPSWDTGDYEHEDLIVESDGHVGFSFSVHPQRGQFDFALSGGEGADKVACLYEVKYGERTYVYVKGRSGSPGVMPGPRPSAQERNRPRVR
jgi:hypothetical protein